MTSKVQAGEMDLDLQGRLSDGSQARRDGQFATSRQIFIACVRKSADVGDQASLAEALTGLADTEVAIGNMDAARHHYSGAVTLYRKLGSGKRLASVLRREGRVLSDTANPGEAEPLYVEAEIIYRRISPTDVVGLTEVLLERACVNDALGWYEVAKGLRAEAGELSKAR